MSTSSRAKGVSAASFVDLIGEVAQKKSEFARNKAAGGSAYIVGGIPRAEKKPIPWLRQNKDVSKRAARDVELETKSLQTYDEAVDNLRKKAKKYKQLAQGLNAGLDDKQHQNLLVDFSSKGDVYESDHESDSSFDEESDPEIDYVDELGRTRTVRRSKVPQEYMTEHQPALGDDIDPNLIIHNPEGYFPTYVHSEDYKNQIREAYAEDDTPKDTHYDASNENRAHGAAHMKFSKDETQRRKEMDSLKTARNETIQKREESGAMDVKAGENTGLLSAGGPRQSKGSVKRARDLEERRRKLDAKRRKTGGQEDTIAQDLTPTAIVHVPYTAQLSTEERNDLPMNRLAAADPSATDPFAALEVQAKSSNYSNGHKSTAVDDFLATIPLSINKPFRTS